MTDILTAIILWTSILLILLLLLILLTCVLCYTFKKLKYKSEKIILREKVMPILAKTVPVGEPITIEEYEPQILQTQQLARPVVQERKKMLRESQIVYEVSPKLVKRRFYDFGGEEVIDQYVEPLSRINQEALKIVCIYH